MATLRSLSLHPDAAGAPHPEAFGSFRVLHQIGAGALGPVFRVYDPEQDKLAAVKLFTLDLAPDRVHRLIAQLQALIDTDLTHPAIAAPLAAGMSGVSAYLAQDFIAADAVDVVARAHGPAPPSDALRVAAHVAAALDCAADALVVHGALHPRDVLVSPDDARLTGFGIARALETIGVVSPVRRPYAAPERVAGQAWDRRTDVFSLAAIIHELLWGRRITALGEEAALSLTAIPGADLDALQYLFARSLAADPAVRFDTAASFADGLTVALGLQSPVASHRSAVGSRQSPVDDESMDVGDLLHPARRLEFVVDEELRLPLDEPEIVIDRGIAPDVNSDVDHNVDHDLNVAKVLAAEPARSDPPGPPIEAVQLPAGVLAFEGFERSERDDEPAEVHTPPAAVHVPPFDAAESASRSAVWPLALALGVGLSVGFALGYASAGRASPGLVVAANTGVAAAPPVPELAARVVSETEVRVPPAISPLASGPASSEPVAPTVGLETALAALAPPAPVAAESSLPLPPTTVVPVTAAPAAAKGPEPRAVEGRLVIRSTPAGATAFVDGREVGKTPVTLREVERGAHTVRVAREGYVPEQRRVTVTAARPSQLLTFALDRARTARPAPTLPPGAVRTADVTVESRPAGASVFVDGRLVGRTPLKLAAVAAGDHSIALELDGYRRWLASVRVVAGEPARVTASLERP
ncbi:MAG: hypothetical protein A3H97_05375 [Acidobacteria bacterium RIFCSPLOWO2_02_FULL_65_29]|nr:MAG: hypothetical protein A3H97_05375 [Acidobacteria bacterium RIFCSPLOWO2_02_FULL_65_29]